jgi:ADP-ribose pyrophosphatase YjhB (NUDIX family)
MRTVTPKNAHPVPDGAERVFKGIIYDVYHYPQTMFDGTIRTFEMLKRPDTVEVLAIKDGNIVAVMDEQPGRSPQFTLPGGRHDVESETELDCAKRELHEETGLQFATWKLIFVEQMFEKIDHRLYIFLATDATAEDEPHVDAGGEKIMRKDISFANAKTLAEKGTDRYWPNQLLKSVSSLDELLTLPEIA